MSLIELKVPDIGESDRIELACWNAKAGQSIQKDQELCELVTDKAAFPLEAPASGKLISILKGAGELVLIGEVLATMEAES